MRKPGGWSFITDGDTGRVSENETFSCKHCNRVVQVQARTDPADVGGLCRICNGLICPQCVGKGCDPLEEKLRRWEASYDARRSYG